MPGLLAILKAALWWLLRTAGTWIGPYIAMALAWFGLQLVVTDYAIQPFIAEIQGALSGAPQITFDLMGALGADRAIAMILSAYVTASAGRIFIRRRTGASP